MIIYEVRFYRRSMEGWEFASNLLFELKPRAIKTLKLKGYKLIFDEENLYSDGSTRATLLERELE